MFTGIVRGIGKVLSIKTLLGLNQYVIGIDELFLSQLEIGASIAIDGVCLTVVNFSANQVTFDAIGETLARTNLRFLKVNDRVNIERAARFGDEVGGHILSGHIVGTAIIQRITQTENNWIISLKCSSELIKYIFRKGYIALNGASLTLVDVDNSQAIFSVHLIPETLLKTTFAEKKVNDPINLEIDTHTQAIVDTLERIYASKSTI